MAELAEYHNLLPALREFVKTGKPVWGYAGLIFLADRAVGQKEGGQELVGGLDCTVHRNFFSSQEDALPETKVIVAVKQRNLLATAFHPELTADTRWHSYFIKMTKETEQGASSSSSSSIVSVGETCVGPEQAKPDLPIFQ